MVVVIVVGMPGSGKDVFLQCAKASGFGHVSMGDTVRRFASASGIDSSDASIGGFAGSERKAHGAAIWAVRTAMDLPGGNVIIDGSRSLDEIKYFRKTLGTDVLVVAVLASQETRFRRLRLRRRDDDPAAMEDLIRRDERELAWGLGEAICSADISLENNGSLEDFRDKCQAALNAVLGSHGKSI